MKPSIKAVIFDVDGVLVDSVPYHFEAWKKMFENNGVAFTYDDYVRRVNGIPRIAGIRAMMPDISENDIQRLTDEKQKYFIESVDEDPPKPLEGVVDFLDFLKREGIIRAAASSSKNSPYVLEKASLDTYFNTIVSGHNFKKSKPDPEIFLTASTRITVQPNQCIVIEDAATGVEAGSRGGMHTVGLLHAGDTKIQKIAELAIHDMKEYKKIIKFYFTT